MLSTLTPLLNSADPDQILQGMQLIDALEDSTVLQQLLQDTTLCRLPVFQSLRQEDTFVQQLTCCMLGPHLSPQAPYSHLVALWAMACLLPRQPDWPIVSGMPQLRLSCPRDGEWVAQQGVALISGDFLLLEEAPPQPSRRAALQALDDRGASPAPSWGTAILAGLGQDLFSNLPMCLEHLPPDLLRELLHRLTALARPARLQLRHFREPTLPPWLSLEGVVHLDLSHSQVASLPRLPDSVQFVHLSGVPLDQPPTTVPGLGLDIQQWHRWSSRLQHLQRLSLEIFSDIPPDTLTGMTALSCLELWWRLPVPVADLLPHLARLSSLTSLTLSGVPEDEAIPAALWRLPHLETLSLDGFRLHDLPPQPPATLRRLQVRVDQIAGLPDAWRAIAEPHHGRAVWLLDVGARKIEHIRLLRSLTHLGLKDAKDQVESTPCLFYMASSNQDAQYILQEIRRLGGGAFVR